MRKRKETGMIEAVMKDGQNVQMTIEDLKKLLDTLPNKCRKGSKGDVMLNEHHIRLVGFHRDNTPGYSQQELDALNCALFRRLEGLEPESDDWHERAKAFSAEVNRR